MKGRRYFHRSAGACPPRSFVAREMFQRCGWHGEGNPLACTCGMRGPKPYGEGVTFFFVARGPVPRVVHRHDVCFFSVVCDRLITNRSRSLGNMPELQTILTYRGDAVCQQNACRGTGFPTALRWVRRISMSARRNCQDAA